MKSDVEFLPERIRHQRGRRRRLVRQGYLLALCAVGMGVLTYVNAVRIDRAKAELATLQERVVNVSRQVEMIGPLRRELAELMIKRRIEEELGSRTDCTAILAELCRIVPPNMALVSLELKTMEVPVGRSGYKGSSINLSSRAAVAGCRAGGAQTVRRARLVITGLAPNDVDVANFIGRLSASPLFEDVNMGYTRSVVFHNRMAREFQASCYLVR